MRKLVFGNGSQVDGSTFISIEVYRPLKKKKMELVYIVAHRYAACLLRHLLVALCNGNTGPSQMHADAE